LIVQYGTSSQVLDACEASLPQLVETGFVQQSSGNVWFLPTEMADCLPEMALTGWTFLEKKYPVLCWFHYVKRKRQLCLGIEVGPIQNSELRIRLLHAIKDGGFSFGEKAAFREEAKYTRILSQRRKLKQTDGGTVDDDPDYVQEVAASMWKKHWQDGKKIIEILRRFDWGV